MNTFMWNSKLTTQHLSKLSELGVEIIMPISKTLACGDVGVGAMEEPKNIVQFLREHITQL